MADCCCVPEGENFKVNTCKKAKKSLAERFALLDEKMEEKEVIRAAFRRGDMSAVQTFSDWVYLWIREVLPNVVKERTRLMYGETMERHILPYLGEKKLLELTGACIEQWTEELQAQEVPFTMDGRMKEGTVRNTLSILSGCLRDAQKWGILQKNPCTEVAETMKSRNVYETGEWLRREELRKLLPQFHLYLAENQYPLGMAYELILYTGISLSEVLALRWRDFNEKTETIRVEAMILLRRMAGNSEDFYTVEPLQGRRNREVPAPAALMRRLLEIRKEYRRGEEDFVVSEDGRTILRPDRFRAWLTRCSRRELGRNVTTRMLRDTYAISALRNGADSDTVAELLGACSSRQIIRRYLPKQRMDGRAIVEEMYARVNS